MPIATPEKYREMLNAARQGKFAFPAINVTSSETLNAALTGFAEAESDGIVQSSTGGAEFLSGQRNKDMPLGARALAEFAHVVADRYPVNIALHTDHCQPNKVDTYVRPLLAISKEWREKTGRPLFQSHMLDASDIPLEENLKLASALLDECSALDIILELEIGIVGGVEDTTDNEDIDKSKLYTSPEDMVRTAEVLGTGARGLYLLAAVFGNVHGVYKPGAVTLKPEILEEGQKAMEKVYGKDKRHYLVFHGGSGSSVAEIHETLDYGVVKMNIDTDMQYAFSRPIAHHMFVNYDSVLKVDGDVGNKKFYDPRSYLKAGESNMTARLVEACDILKSTGKTIGV